MNDILTRAVVEVAVAGRTLSGLAVPWDRAARVVDPGARPYLEAFAPSSCEVSLRQATGPYPLYALHGWKRNELPIGATTFERSLYGLAFSSYLSDTRAADEAIHLYNDGVLGGVSLGFQPIRDRPQRTAEGTVTVRTEVRLKELSLCPQHLSQYPDAKVLSVRSELEGESPPVPLTRAEVRAAMAKLDAQFEEMVRKGYIS